MSLVEVLAREIGPRPAGSPEAARAAEAVAEALAALGLEPRFQEFPLLGYEAEEPELEVDGERIPAGPCVYSQPSDGWVEGRVRRIGRWTELGAALQADAPAFAVEDGGREVARLYGSPFGGGAIPFVPGVSQLLAGPTVFVSAADAARLENGATARLRTFGRFVPGLRERNVLAELPGQNDERVVVSAHYDSVWRGPGAIDNATGVEGVRRVAEALVGTRPARTIVFAAFAAEEIGMIGSHWFVHDAKLRGELERVKAVVNLDCVAHGERMSIMAGPDDLRARAEAAARALGFHERYDLDVVAPGSGVDGWFFAQEGVPTVDILHFPYPEYHSISDRPELVDERLLADSVALALELVRELASPAD